MQKRQTEQNPNAEKPHPKPKASKIKEGNQHEPEPDKGGSKYVTHILTVTKYAFQNYSYYTRNIDNISGLNVVSLLGLCYSLCIYCTYATKNDQSQCLVLYKASDIAICMI